MSVWDKRSEESIPAWNAFKAYRDYGLRRSIDAAWRKYNQIDDDSQRASRHWFIWSSDHKWESRTEAHDLHLEAIAQQAREERAKQLGQRRAEFEHAFQDAIEDRFGKLRLTLEKAEQAPVTDITRKEEKEVVAGRNGELTSTVLTTKIKGTNLSGYARLNKEFRDTGAQAINGPRPLVVIEKDQSSNHGTPEMPPFVVQLAPTDHNANGTADPDLRRQ